MKNRDPFPTIAPAKGEFDSASWPMSELEKLRHQIFLLTNELEAMSAQIHRSLHGRPRLVEIPKLVE